MSRISVDAFPDNGINYPFVAFLPELPYLVEDLHISTIVSPLPSLWLKWYRSDVGLPPQPDVPAVVNAVDMLIADDEDNTVFDTREMQFEQRLWSGNRYICTWTSESTVIVATIQKDPQLASGYATQKGLLDPRATDWRPRPLTDLKVSTARSVLSAVRSDGTVKFREGYNSNLLASTGISERGERIQLLDVDYAAGAGLGRYAGCDFNLGITNLGGAVPNAIGDVLINGDSCFSFTPKLLFGPGGATLVPGTFLLRDGCEAPCNCDDFASLYKYIRRTWSRYQAIAGQANQIRSAYHAIRDYMASAKECSERQTLRVFVWPIRPCTFAAAVGICNPTDEPLHDVVIDFSISDANDVDLGANASCDSIYRVDYFQSQVMPTPYYFEQPLPNARIVLRCIPPGSMGYVVFRGIVPESGHEQPVKICAICPVGVPLPLKTPDTHCGHAELVCEEPENCV